MSSKNDKEAAKFAILEFLLGVLKNIPLIGPVIEVLLGIKERKKNSDNCGDDGNFNEISKKRSALNLSFRVVFFVILIFSVFAREIAAEIVKDHLFSFLSKIPIISNLLPEKENNSKKEVKKEIENVRKETKKTKDVVGKLKERTDNRLVRIEREVHQVTNRVEEVGETYEECMEVCVKDSKMYGIKKGEAKTGCNEGCKELR
ncbi:MAG: hypothetical protein HOE80_02815 [Candidatus Magasanikbacteria bacterium]|jgi:hypothetical protein|nr:hypothetical protein [Candidatus Magasanikbacteria bacterium]MBT4071630.1 hypothetical protein [Candidatus Magasanikbacteria bacterium]